MAELCSGLNVVEMGSGSIAAAMTGMILADAGARVVTVEPPSGDRLRTEHPSGSLVWNRGKESVVADLRTPEGHSMVRALAADADVVIEAFAPGTTERWGLGAESLAASNPALVQCRISGFGRHGSYSGLKGYDSLVAAKCGLWARGAWGHRSGPIVFPVPWASFGAAMESVAGIVGALLVRETTGRGQIVDANMVLGLDPLEYFVATIVQLMTKRGESASSDSRAATATSRFGVLVATRDGRFIQTSTVLPHQAKALCEVAGVGQALDDPRFSRCPTFDSPDDAQAFEDLLLEAFRAHDLAHWMPRLLDNPDVPFEVAVTPEQALDHPQLQHNGDVVTVTDPTRGPIRQVGPLGHFSETPIVISRPAPQVGQNQLPLAPRNHQFSLSSAPAEPFAGITIVEFGYFYAMPFGLTMLAALGARVIKIEDGSGDPHRVSFGPEVASTKTTAGKESVSLDLRTAEGRRIAQEIVTRADAFVTGFRSGVADKLGLGYEELAKMNPRLLYVHAAGYGSDGPYAHRALYAQAASAAVGSFGRQVGYWMAPDLNTEMSVMELQAIVLPRLNQVVDGDSNAALAVLAAVSLGLYHQRRTGRGQLLRTSMVAGNAFAYSDDFCSYTGKPPAPLGDSEYYGAGALDRVYEAADGSWVCLVVRTDEEFARLAAELGIPRLATDQRFATAEARASNDSALESQLADAFRTRSAADWEKSLSAADVGCVDVNLTGQPVFTSYDAVLRESGLTVQFEHPLYGEMTRSAPVVSFSESSVRVAPPCLRGQHNRSVLGELGYDDGTIADLEQRGVLVAPATSP